MKALLAIGLAVLLQPAQPAKYDLLWKPKQGQKLVYALNVSGTLADNPFLFSADVHMAIKKVEANGDYTVGTIYKNQVTKALGETEKLQEDPEELMRFNARGKSLDPDTSTSAEEDSVAELVGRAGEFEKPLKPVHVGDTWTHEFPEDRKLGLVKATGKYRLVSAENGKLRISMAYSEDSGTEPTKINGLAIIRESDGATIDVTSEVLNARIMDGLPATKLKLTLKLK